MNSTWLTRKIAELPIDIIDGDRSKRYPKRSEFQDSGIPFLNSTNIDNGRLDLGQLNFISPEKYAQIKKGRLRPMDIIMTTRGSIGKVVLFNDPQYTQGLINAQMLVIRADGEVIDQEFLFFYLCSDIFQKLVSNFASGSAQPQIPIRDLQDIPVVYPSLPTQRKIAAILSAYDDLIENNTRRIALLERMAQLLYREWFVRFRFPGHASVRMVASALGEIPEGWEVVKLGDVIELAYGKGLRRKDRIQGAYPVYGSSGIIDYHNEPLVEGPGIIVGRKGNVGSVFWSDAGFYPIDTVFYVVTNVNLRYVFYNLQAQNFLSTDTAVPGLSRNQAYLQPFLLPEEAMMQKFEYFVKPIFDQAHNLTERNEVLRRTRDLLLPRLISGEVDVAELAIGGLE
ncbi:MAG: restriction endonuclease subunit S [Anaerolineae bacterium]